MKYIKKVIKYIFLTTALLIVYLLVVTLLSFIIVNKNNDIQNREYTIYILSNGVHTDIVVPAKTEIKDWTKEVPYQNTISKDSTAQYLAMGWGDKGFYLDTPTWADLKFSTAIKAVSGFNTTAIHATYYKNLKENEHCKKIQISTDDYKRLVSYIEAEFQKTNGKTILISTNAVYGKTDAFYEANGHYSLFYTCNSWANQALKSANQKAALWTISDAGIFRQYQ